MRDTTPSFKGHSTVHPRPGSFYQPGSAKVENMDVHRFCILKLLEQNKGATKCPLCNGNISKKTLQEDVRFKLVIKGVMEAIGALERDTGFSSAGDHQKMVETASATALQEKQTTVESKGYRGRQNGEEKAEKRNSALQCRNSHSPAPNRTATRCSLRKKSNSSKTVCFEIGCLNPELPLICLCRALTPVPTLPLRSDSSEDHFQKIGTVRRVGLRSGSWSPNGERHSQKPSHSPRHAQFQEPNGEDVVLLGTPDVLDLSEAALGRPEGLRASTRSGGALKEDEAMEERQDLSLPVPCLGRHRVSSSTQEGVPCSLPSVERSHLANEAADPSPNKQVGNKVEMVDMLQPAGSAQVCDLVREDEEELPPAFPRSPLSPLSGAALIQSIQKVNEWFSKSKILSPAPLQEVNAGEGDSDLKPHLSGVDTHLFRKTELREDQWEGAAGWRAGRPCPKLVASRMVDKIFGRRYVRTRKSNPICSERETIHIPSKENFTAVNTQSSDAPVRKIPAQNKPTPDLTSEYVTKEQTATEDSEGAGGHASAVLEEDGPGHAAVGGTPEGAQRPAEHPEKKGASGCEVDASPVRCHSCNMQNLKKARPSLRRRSRQPGRPAGALQLAVQESSGPPEKAEAQDDGPPSSEEPQENGTGQTPVRRSKRLLSRAEEEHGGSEPAKKRRKQLHEAEKEQGKAQVGSGAPLIAEGGPGVLRVGLAAGARKVCGASPDGKSFLSAGCPTERDRPCPVVPGAVSPGSHLAKEEQNHPKAEGLAAVPQAEQSAACAPERHRVCPRDVRGSCRSPRAGHEATGDGELNLGTDDSELDAAFVGKIFRLCKRQSFSLCSPPAKRPATEPQTERRVDGVEGSRAAACVKKSAPSPAGVSEDRREAIPSGVAGGTARLSPVLHPSHSCDPGELSERLQVTLQAPFPDSSCKPAKEAENGDPLQSQQPASDKGESPGTEKTSGDCSSDLWRTGNFQGTGLPPADETSSHAGPSLETRPESDRNKTLACSFCSEPIQPLPVARQLWPPGSGSVGSAGGVKGTGEQIAPMLSTGAFEGPLDRSPEEEIPGFSVLSDTPEGLLGPATDIKGRSLNPPEVGLQATLVVFTRTDQGGPLKEEALECSSSSSSSSGSGPGGLARGCQRRVPKLSSSSEDEELQCFQALVSGQATSSPSQPAKEAEASAGILAQQSSSQSSPQGGYLSEESEGSMDLFSSHSRGFEDFASKLCGTRPFTPAPTGQRKAMTPRSATEPLGEICRDAEQLLDGRQGCINAEPSLGEALGCDSEVSNLGDSSGFSSKSEILTTQQKDALQSNLERLQQEISVIEAALKEGGRGASEEVWPPPGQGRTPDKRGQSCDPAEDGCCLAKLYKAVT
uniref:Uncharacterized protein n=1 Tax=Sphaerodactylus townsendi TaxID=933632 RepID=A0ACB8ETQ6_9SAUR